MIPTQVRTPGPCGMPKGQAKTTFEAGTQFNVTWHLAYPHQGGFKLELFDSEGELKTNLTETGWINDDTTAQSHRVTLPEKEECLD